MRRRKIWRGNLEVRLNRPEGLARLGRVLRVYVDRVSAFHPNARLYLVSAVISGASMGVFRLLFNFYVLSLGFDEELLGNLVTTSSLTGVIRDDPRTRQEFLEFVRNG